MICFKLNGAWNLRKPLHFIFWFIRNKGREIYYYASSVINTIINKKKRLIEFECKSRKVVEDTTIDKKNIEQFKVTEFNMPCYQPLVKKFIYLLILILKVPRQTNYQDCGVYMMEYIEQFIKDPKQILDGIQVLIHSLFLNILILYYSTKIK